MIRLLHTADWHLGRRLEGRNRHDEQCQVLDEICRIAEEEQVDAVVVAGDLFDSYNPPAESEALFYRTMLRLAANGSRAVIVIAGNHDSPDRLLATDPYARALGITTLGYPKDIPAIDDRGSERVSCIDSAPSFVRLRLPRPEKVLTLLALPYPSETRLREIITWDMADEVSAARDYNARIGEFMRDVATRFDPEGANVIASHLFVADGEMCESERQIQVGGAYTVDPASFPHQAAYVALGHLHRPQEKRGKHDIPVRYSGSILQYSFSEAGQRKEVTIVEFEGGKMAHRSVPLTAGKKLECWENVQGTEELERRLAEVDPSTWLSVVVTLEKPWTLDYAANLRSCHPGMIRCIPQFRDSDGALTDTIRISDLSLEEQFIRFVETRFGEPCGDEVLKLFLELAGREGEG